MFSAGLLIFFITLLAESHRRGVVRRHPLTLGLLATIGIGLMAGSLVVAAWRWLP